MTAWRENKQRNKQMSLLNSHWQGKETKKKLLTWPPLVGEEKKHHPPTSCWEGTINIQTNQWLGRLFFLEEKQTNKQINDLAASRRREKTNKQKTKKPMAGVGEEKQRNKQNNFMVRWFLSALYFWIKWTFQSCKHFRVTPLIKHWSPGPGNRPIPPPFSLSSKL